MSLEKLQITDNFLALGMRRRGQGSHSRPTVLAADSGRIEAADYLMAPSISVTGTSNMAKGLTASSLAAALTLASLAGASGQPIPRLAGDPGASRGGQASRQTGGQSGAARPPTDAEMAARAKVLL